jgi:hypothetical protein
MPRFNARTRLFAWLDTAMGATKQPRRPVSALSRGKRKPQLYLDNPTAAPLPRVTFFPQTPLLQIDSDHALPRDLEFGTMSQPSVPWTSAATDPFVPSIEEEYIIQTQVDEAFKLRASDQPIFPSTYNDNLDDINLAIDNGFISQAESSNPSTVSTPTFSNYGFGEQQSFYTPSGPNTPVLHPLEDQQIHHAQAHPALYRRPLTFRAHTNAPSTVNSQPPQGHDRRRSLSHSDVDRIAAAPPHPTFVRLQHSQVSRASSATAGDKTVSGVHARHGRSVSQGPSHLGRPFKNAVSYALPGSSLGTDMPLGTSIGTPLGAPFDERGSRKRSRHPDNGGYATQYGNDDPYIHQTTDPARLEHSRRIIEIGAMAVRNHTKLDPRLEDNDGLSAHERVVKKVEDVERYLQQNEAQNEEALKGCAMIREALNRKASHGNAGTMVDPNNANAEEEPSDAPNKLMLAEDNGLFGGYLAEDDLMSLLMMENERLDYDKGKQ